MSWSGGFELVKGGENPFFSSLELMIRGLEEWLPKIEK